MMLWLLCVLTSLVDPLSGFDEQRIPATAGQGSVTLTFKTGEKTNIIAVEWRRPDLHPDCVLFYRDGHFHSDLQHPSFRNRVDLQDEQMKDGDVSLILKDVTTKDTGTYECRVVTQSDSVPQLISSIHLDVAPPEQTITAEAGQDSVTLPCGAGKGKEIIVVEWRRPDLRPDVVLVLRDDQLYLDDQHPSFRNRVDLQDRQMKDGDASLILKNVKIKDTGRYDCAVIQGGGNRRKRAVTETISSIHLVVSPPETQEGGDEEGGGKEARGDKEGGGEDGGCKEGGSAGRGHRGLVPGLVLVLGLVSVLGIVAVVAAVLFRKRKRTPPPRPDEEAAVRRLVQTQSSDNSPPPPPDEAATVQPLV